MHLTIKHHFYIQTFCIMSSPYLDVCQVGGEGGDEFDFLGKRTGNMVSIIQVWVGGEQIRGVKIGWASGLSKHVGQNGEDCSKQPFEEHFFQRGEIITKMSLWTNLEQSWKKGGKGKDSHRLAAIYFKTNKGREFFPRMKNTKLENEFPIEVGSGICSGVQGRSGSDIDKIGFQFVKPLMSSVMTDVTYPTIAKKQVKINIDTLDNVVYTNDLEVEQTFTHETTVTTTTKQYWSKKSDFERTINVKVTASIPILKSTEVEVTGGVKESSSDTYEMADSETKTKKWTFPITVPAKSKVQVTVSMGKAHIGIPYEGKIVITTEDGCKLSYDMDGTYYGVAFTDVAITTKKV